MNNKSKNTAMSIPTVRESELTPLERGLIGQVSKLIASVETLTASSNANMTQLRSENERLLQLLNAQEKRIKQLQNDILSFEKKLRP